jgi:hypothetical protein
MQKSFLAIALFSCFNGFSQNDLEINKDTLDLLNKTKKWVTELYEPGLKLENDIVYVSEEFKILLNNKEYRKIVYPDTYTWEMTTALLKASRFKIAFWHLLRLYPQSEKNKELVMRVLITYDQIFKVDKVLSSVLYTYVFCDPEISAFKAGKPEIIRPDLFEAIRSDVLEISSILVQARKETD